MIPITNFPAKFTFSVPVMVISTLELDNAGVLRFLRFFSSLKQDSSVYRLFHHSKARCYSVHGENDLDVVHRLNPNAQQQPMFQLHAPNGNSLKPLDSLTFDRNMARKLTSDALFSMGKHVELYEVSPDGRPNLTAKGTPGALGELESSILISRSTVQEAAHSESDYTVLAVKVRTAKGNKILGIACWDLSKRRLSLSEIQEDSLFSTLESVVVGTNAKEVVFCEGDLADMEKEKITEVLEQCHAAMSVKPRAVFSQTNSHIALDLETLSGSKISLSKFLDLKLACVAASGLLRYSNIHEDAQLEGKVRIEELANRKFLQLDSAALKALNVFPRPGDSSKTSSIFGLMNCTKTAMGARTLRRWLTQPLQNIDAINKRLDLVTTFFNDRTMCASLRQDFLRKITDVDAMCNRFTRQKGSKASLSDMVTLYQCSVRLPSIIRCLEHSSDLIKATFVGPFLELSKELSNFEKLVETTIDLERVDSGEFLVNPGVNEALVDLRRELDNVEHKIKVDLRSIQDSLDLKETIKLERKDGLGHVYRITRKYDKHIQGKSKFNILETHKSGIKFQTKALFLLSKKYEELMRKYDVIGSEMRMKTLQVAGSYVDVFLDVSTVLGELDVLSTFANIALEARNTYCRPKILGPGEGLILKSARHPIVEENIDSVDSFIANDMDLRRKAGESGGGGVLLISGPNAGGKSTYCWQAGVATLLAHIGAYVPAEEAHVPLTDRILCRVGAGDNHHCGTSTFMAEMLETSSILKNATSNSLVIIDELGRGTGTTDGFGLAYAICSHIANEVKASCLFATHFHELSALTDKIDAVRNYHVNANVAPDGSVTFLYEVLPGGCDRSFGVNVAASTHFPKSVVSVAKRKADDLESNVAHVSQNVSAISDIITQLRLMPRKTPEERAAAVEKTKQLLSDPKLSHLIE